MNSKHIKSHLNKKLDDFMESITDEDVKQKIKKGTIITGGALVSLVTSEKVNDYDIYFRDRETLLAVGNYYLAKYNQQAGTDFTLEEDEDQKIKIFIKSSGVAEEISIKVNKTVDEKYRIVFMSSNAITLSDDIQLVFRFYGEPEEIHENYDFIHCKNYWTSWNNNLVFHVESLIAIINKELIYNGSKYPLCSIIRARKFIQRGWHINAGQYLKMALDLNQYDLNDVEVLKDQLTGVDSAYFAMMFAALGIKKNVDSSYVMELVDKIF